MTKLKIFLEIVVRSTVLDNNMRRRNPNRFQKFDHHQRRINEFNVEISTSLMFPSCITLADTLSAQQSKCTATTGKIKEKIL